MYIYVRIYIYHTYVLHICITNMTEFGFLDDLTPVIQMGFNVWDKKTGQNKEDIPRHPPLSPQSRPFSFFSSHPP